MNDNIKKLHSAAYTGDLRTVIQLLKNEIDIINAQNSKGYTVLMATLLGDGNKKRKGEILDYLLCSDANVNAFTKDGDSVLHIAVKASMTKVMSTRFVEMLLEHGADHTLKNNLGQTASQLAFQLGNAKLGEYLIFYEPTPTPEKKKSDKGMMDVLCERFCHTYSFHKQIEEDIATLMVKKKET